MIWAALAWADPPSGVDPEDIARWQTGRQAMLAGPPGCWDLSGHVEITIATYTPATLWSRGSKESHPFAGSFSGRFDGGLWTSLDYDLSPADKPGEPAKMDLPLFPLVGKIDPHTPHRTNPGKEGSGVEVSDADTQTRNLVDQILEDLHPDTTTAYGEWREADQAVVLIEDVPLSSSARSEVFTLTTTFPHGGPPTALDGTFPPRVERSQGLVTMKLLDAQAHLRAQTVGDVVLPALDSLSLAGGALGFTVGYEQKLVYQRASRCPAP